ncbi:hypothetical protein QG033_08635, partial [Kingella kingae]|nr:hypothetical protein [Kingella kingae]
DTPFFDDIIARRGFTGDAAVAARAKYQRLAARCRHSCQRTQRVGLGWQANLYCVGKHDDRRGIAGH